MAFDLARPFHVAQVVTDLDAAMRQVGAALDLTWHTVQERTLRVWWNGEVSEATIRFTYSREGEPHYELLQGTPGSIWGPDQVGMHHVGVWTDDFLADVARLEAAGFAVEAKRQTDDGTPKGFTYQTSPHGLRVELVPESERPAFERWFAGGEFR